MEEESNKSKLHPAWYLVLFVSVCLSSLAIAFFVKGGVGDMNRLTERKEELREKIREKQDKYDQLQAREKRLHQDPYLIEELARQRLGLGRPGEKVVELEDTGETVTEKLDGKHLGDKNDR